MTEAVSPLRGREGGVTVSDSVCEQFDICTMTLSYIYSYIQRIRCLYPTTTPPGQMAGCID